MDFILSKEKPEHIECDLIAVACFEEPKDNKRKAPPAKLMMADGGLSLDRALKGELSRMIQASSFTGAADKTKILYTEGLIPARHVLVVGLGKKQDATLATIRSVAARIAKVADELQITRAAFVLTDKTFLGAKPPQRLKAIVEGMELGRYSFEMYKAQESRSERTLKSVYILSARIDGTLTKAIAMGHQTASATILARDMSNTPGNDMTPTIVARFARNVAEKGKLEYHEMGPEQMRKERMGAFLAVAQGSAEPPTFVHLRYKPKGASRKTIALVGKGVTFDSGGISIKPARGMEQMKDDMGGAAAVIGVMTAVAELKPRVTIDAYIAATENMPDGKAIKPGDIVTARNGKTIEFITTDAEGRMILADALSFAVDKKPDCVIDLATLTGSCPYAVGEKYAAILGTDQKLIDALMKAGNEAGEPVWQLPLEKDYIKGLTTGPADLKNVGTSKADTINGGLFLSHFIGETPWAHLDIASTAWASEASNLSPKGATGAGVRILVQFLMNI